MREDSSDTHPKPLALQSRSPPLGKLRYPFEQQRCDEIGLLGWRKDRAHGMRPVTQPSSYGLACVREVATEVVVDDGTKPQRLRAPKTWCDLTPKLTCGRTY